VGAIFGLQVKFRSQAAMLDETESLSNKAAVIGSALESVTKSSKNLRL
jgi:hypothetical protein